MISPDDRKAWREAAGELRYLAIRLQGYVAELPTQSLPPRGRVPWSPAEVGNLLTLTASLDKGEGDASRAAASLEAIDTVFHRARVDAAVAPCSTDSDVAVAALQAAATPLEHYLKQRAIALDSLPRLQRFGETLRESGSTPRPLPGVPLWRRLWARAVATVLPRRAP